MPTRRRWRRRSRPRPTRCARPCAAWCGIRRRARRRSAPAITRQSRPCTWSRRPAVSSRSSARSRAPRRSAPICARGFEARGARRANEAMFDYIQFVLAPQMLTGLAVGMAVILVALGLTIIFGLLDVINMAHGEFYALGAFLSVALGALGVPFWLLLVLVPLAMLPLGYVVERTLIQRVFDTKDRHVTTLLLTLGLGLVLEDAFRLVFGPNPYKPETPIRGAIDLAGIFLPKYRLFMIVIGAVVITGVALVVYRTRLGAMVRAAAFDRQMAGSLGVPVTRVYAGAFAFGVALAGL